MNFEKLLSTFDMGVCADQVQREAVFDLVLLFAAIDGDEAPQELSFISNWMEQSPWNSGISKKDFRIMAKQRVEAAVENTDFEGFIKQRATVLANSPAKEETVNLIEQLIAVDGRVDDAELKGLACLQKFLR